MIGHFTYASASAGVVTIDQNGVATAQAPGSTLITGTIAQTSSNAGYFYTCPPAKIALSVASTGATNASVTLNTPLALTATVTDVNNNVINGLALSYVSTNPGSIAVSATGAVTAAFPSNSAITAICQPTSCNPAPINEMGTLGNGRSGDQQLCADRVPGQEQQLHLDVQSGVARTSCPSICRPARSGTRSRCPIHPTRWCWIPRARRFISAAIKN